MTEAASFLFYNILLKETTACLLGRLMFKKRAEVNESVRLFFFVIMNN